MPLSISRVGDSVFYKDPDNIVLFYKKLVEES